MEPIDVTRREFLGAAAIAGAVSLEAATPEQAGQVHCSLTINKQPHQLSLDPRVTVLDLLREHLHLPGTKKGCDHGQCGACTVLVNGRRVNSCLTLAVAHDGDEITTIEGLASGERPASHASGISRTRRLPVRVLHAGANLLRGRHA